MPLEGTHSINEKFSRVGKRNDPKGMLYLPPVFFYSKKKKKEVKAEGGNRKAE